jgi:adenine-specific DNA-methyltransferase
MTSNNKKFTATLPFYLKLENLLKKDERFLDKENSLLTANINDAAYKADQKLIEALLSDSEIKAKFFSKIKDVLVFNINDFVAYVQDKNFLNDSYTKFKNKIGINIDGKYLNERKEVSLVWPFKDCVLEGGMSKEDQKRKEIFFNETLAQDEIDKLFAPKVLTNWKRYTASGIIPAKSGAKIKRDKDGVIRENLIIKGNNLLALHSLKSEFQGKVKLIYIDPPYNTEGADDSFKYNDNFDHSTWLTFMKNRLEVAKELLSKDGAIYIQLDYNEVHYCKVLMDEVFGRENFQREIIWRIGWVSGYKSAGKNWIRNHDTILFYSKDKDNLEFFKNYIPYPKDYVRRDGAKPKGNGYPYEDTWNSNDLDPLNSIAIVSFSKEKVGDFKGQKNEALLQRIIEPHTKEGELVVDFFSGTGTTAAVAHKLKRQWITVEQIDRQVDKQVARLKSTIGGDQSGISKIISWKGGGEFLYCELMKYNEKFVEEIEKAKDVKVLLKIWAVMKEKGFFNYNIDLKAFEENIGEFKKLSLSKQKEVLLLLLNKNQLYVNLSEIDDGEFKVGKEDKEMNKEFYR